MNAARFSVPARFGSWPIVVAALLLSPVPARASARPGPLMQLSGASPFASCTFDGIGSQPGLAYVGAEVEPWIAVNPADTLNIVAVWQQDRWSNGGARGFGAGVTVDGGDSWSTLAVPGLTLCAGGAAQRATDPWISFGPDGKLHLAALLLNVGTGSDHAMTAQTSADGGLTWDPLRVLTTGAFPYLNDKESITADAGDANLVYAVWDRIQSPGGTGPTIFTRSTDGGDTWEPVREILSPVPGSQTIGNQIVVLPDGTVMNFFTEILPQGVKADVYYLAFQSSIDRGVTWLPAGSSERIVEMAPRHARDPDGGLGVRDGGALFDVAVDPRNGWLYLVWQDGEVAGAPVPAVAFMMSKDRGITWSAPVTINLTPPSVLESSRQAFTPSVHVTENGAIGVTHYDFRFNGLEPGALTDYWLITCHPQASDCADPSRWREEVRLTDHSFDLEQAPQAGGLFLGDYVGLSSAGDDFLALFTMPHDADSASAFVRRVSFEAVIEPRDAAFWRSEIVAATSRHGQPTEETRASILGYLQDVRAAWDTFDKIRTLKSLKAIMNVPPSGSPRARARRQLMTLVLNLASLRLSPFALVEPGVTVAGAASSIEAVIRDRKAARADLEAAGSLAEAINSGALPLN